ncbi:hypothetical protein PM082_002182 [Marasmius tenuissimus]|nr:hypothetical protein PM082_002182 [Marasmius tenuissimus]
MEMDDAGYQYPDDDEAVSPSPLPFPSGLDASTLVDNPRASTRRSPKKPEKTPEERAIQFDTEWQRLLATLEDSFINYREQTYGKYPDPSQPVIYRCKTGQYHRSILLKHCQCQSLPQTLVVNGLFPTSPLRHLNAVSIRLLDTYQALCQRSSDAITALSGALGTIYRRYGHHTLNKTGSLVLDPLRRALGSTLQYYDSLNIRIERRLDALIEATKRILPPVEDNSPPPPRNVAPTTTNSLANPTPQRDPTTTATTPLSAAPAPSTPPNAEAPEPKPGQCHEYLQRMCPACFGGTTFGRTFNQGGDIHVALDGNLHHRHLKTGGDGQPFYESARFLTKEFIDAVGSRIAEARKGPKKPRTPTVPDKAVDACQNSYKAAKGDDETHRDQNFDENGVMALVCRHDIPLFLASIDTPAEQQKHAVALLEMLFSMIPKHATVAGLYDVGCVLDRSCQMYDLLPNDIVERLIFATSILHSYGHQWVYQIFYNPRLRTGLGLTDGEGVERLWSRLRRIIGVERRSSQTRRIWLIDCQCDYIVTELQDDYGQWFDRRMMKNIQKKEVTALRQLERDGIPHDELRELWNQQKAAQRSWRAHAPARLKKEAAKVFELQNEIEVLEVTIATTRAMISKMAEPSAEAIALLVGMEANLRAMKKKAADLYASLNLPENHPETAGLSMEIVTLLLLARDLKINLRARVIGRLHECDRLDQAVGGVGEALGTRLHQQTWKSISRRTKSLENDIRKFNKYCVQLEALSQAQPDAPFVVPQQLPLQLSALKDMDTSDLWEDVWILRGSAPPRWLVDEKVRRGIRLVLALDRSREERERLCRETEHLLRWFTVELQALEVMARQPAYVCYQSLLRHRLDEHRLRISQWSSSIAPAAKFRERAAAVQRWLDRVSTPSAPIPHFTATTSRPQAPNITSPLQPVSNSTRSVLTTPGPHSPTHVPAPEAHYNLYSYAPSPYAPTASNHHAPNIPTPSPSSHRPVHPTPIAQPTVPTPPPCSQVNSQYRMTVDTCAPTPPAFTPASESPASTQMNQGQVSYDVDSDTGSESDLEICELQAPEALTLADVIDNSETDSDDEDEHTMAEWTVSDNLQYDPLLWAGVKQANRNIQIQGPFSAERQLRADVRTLFLRDTLTRIDKETAWLSADCVNSCSALLRHSFGGDECALISTFAMQTFLNDKRTGPATIWRLLRATKYWTKKTWIIPIHDSDRMHWIVAIVRRERKQILLFDSFADRASMSDWLPKIEMLVSCLAANAIDQGYEIELKLSEWSSRPLVLSPLQTNSYDCGVWVLWVTLATLRGYDMAHVDEGNIRIFRKYISRLIRTLPLCT